MSNLQIYLNQFNDFENLKRDLLLNNLLINENDNLCIIKYDKHIVDFKTHAFLRECRGTIIEKKTNKIICLPIIGGVELDEFKNKVNWKDCVIEESIDGTLITLYYYNGRWNTATKSTFDGNCCWNSQETFHNLFEDAVKCVGLNYKILDTDFCYSFVLCHPKSRNITNYTKPRLYHVSSRNMKTFKEKNEEIGIEKPKLIKLGTFNQCGANTYDELLEVMRLNMIFDKEGYMLYNKDRQYRVKIQNPNFAFVHKLKGNHPNILYRLLELQNHSDKDKFLVYFPEYKQKMDNLENDLVKLVDILDSLYTNVKKNRDSSVEIPKIYKKIIILLHNEYRRLMDNYKPNIHSYKPNINKRKIRHFLDHNVEPSYLVSMIKNIHQVH